MIDQALHEMTNEAHVKLLMPIQWAIESEDQTAETWQQVERLAERLVELAQQAQLRHKWLASKSPENLAKLAKLCNTQGDREAR